MGVGAEEGVRPEAGIARVACVGAGNWGKNLIRNFHDLGALELVCETNAPTRKGVSEGFPDVPVVGTFDEVLRSSVQAVAIATPAETHGGLVRRALEAGKDVFVEKPLCLDPVDGRALVDLARERGRILMVGHLLWYHPAVLELKRLVESGALGRIQYIYSNRLNLGRIRREENILWSFAPHDVSVILGLVGDLPETVHAQSGNYLHERIADVTVSTFSFASGIKGHIFVSWLHPFKEQKLVVVGDRQMAVFNDVEKQDKLVLYPHQIHWKNNAPVADRAEGHPVQIPSVEPLREECAHFLECVGKRSTPRTDGEEALRVLRVLDACQRSLEEGTQEVKGEGRPTRAEPESPSYFLHESSYVDEGAEVGEGTTIWHFSHVLRGSRVGTGCRIGQNVVIGPNVSVGDGVKIQNNVSVYEGVTLEDHVFCGPSMVFTNVRNPRSEIRRMDEILPTVVRRGASLGANCTIVCGTTIGRYAFVGAGTVVLRDVPDHALVVGNPGRIIGWWCQCGDEIDFDPDGQGTCRECQRAYTKRGQIVTPTEISPSPSHSST